jgi:hypothetical protein
LQTELAIELSSNRPTGPSPITDSRFNIHAGMNPASGFPACLSLIDQALPGYSILFDEVR